MVVPSTSDSCYCIGITVKYRAAQVLLPFWLSSPVAAVLEICLLTYPSSSRQPSAAKGPQQQQQQQPRSECIAQLQLPCSSVASQQSGRPFLLRDLPVTAATAAAAAVGKASLQVIVWEVVAYLEQLKRLLAERQQPRPKTITAAAAGGSQLNSLLVAEVSGLQQSPRDSSRGVPPGPQSVTTNPRAVGNMLDTLIGDVAAKQQALEKIQRALDVADSRREIAVCRMADTQDKNRSVVCCCVNATVCVLISFLAVVCGKCACTGKAPRQMQILPWTAAAAWIFAAG